MLRLRAPSRYRSSLSGLVVLIAGSACAGQPSPTYPKEDAWDLLQRIYAQPFPLDLVAFQTRLPSDDHNPVTVKLIVTKGRSLVSQVLEPTSRSGYVILDDGSLLKNYDPDTKVIYSQPSPNLYRPGLKDRMTWARENYEAKLEGTREVAGRKGVVVRLKPKHGEMPSRRMTIDTTQDFLLRSEKQVGGRWVETVNTKIVSYGRSKEQDDARDPFPLRARLVTAWGPKSVSRIDPKELSSLIGFKLDEPEEIPYGFHIVARHVVGSSWDDPSLAYRLSDGVASVTVYAWSPAKVPLGPSSPNSIPPMETSDNGIRFATMGDVSKAVLKQIAEVFAQAERSTWELSPHGDSLPTIFQRPIRRANIPPRELK